MAYSDFTLNDVRKSLGKIIKRAQLFEIIESIELPKWLREILDKGMPLAFISEKARSEFIVVPILLAVRELNHNSFSIYSGQRLDVEPSCGLTGECDFILTNTPPLPILQSPIISIVEAKKNDIEKGLGQCAAQMVGAQSFNQQEGNDIKMIFGCVTTGEDWQFLKLENDTIYIDNNRYYIVDVDKILGIFQSIITCYNPHHSTSPTFT